VKASLRRQTSRRQMQVCETSSDVPFIDSSSRVSIILGDSVKMNCLQTFLVGPQVNSLCRLDSFLNWGHRITAAVFNFPASGVLLLCSSFQWMSSLRGRSPVVEKMPSDGNLRDASEGSLLAGHFSEGHFCLLPENIHQNARLGSV
jgi:hypothetical protein